MKFNKSLGQNFLKSKNTARKFVDLFDKLPAQDIIEIGGGGGIISSEIVSKFLNNGTNSKLTIFEIDRLYALKLFEKYQDNPNIEVKCENILDTNLETFKDSVVIGAIPYNITSPIIHKLLKLKNRPKEILLIVQYEVAKKITAPKNDFNYWSHITLGYEVKFLGKINKDEFVPEPEVDSGIIKFNLISNPYNDAFTFDKWSKFLHHVFKNPRKMINKTFNKESLELNHIEPTLRPQNLSTEEIKALYTIHFNSN